MAKLKLKVGDNVIVRSGADKGLKGNIIKSYPSKGKVLVQGVNIKHKYVKPSQANPNGGVLPMERPIDSSKVAHIDPKTGLPTRVGYKFLENGTKVRYAKKSGEVLDNAKIGG